LLQSGNIQASTPGKAQGSARGRTCRIVRDTHRWPFDDLLHVLLSSSHSRDVDHKSTGRTLHVQVLIGQASCRQGICHPLTQLLDGAIQIAHRQLLNANLKQELPWMLSSRLYGSGQWRYWWGTHRKRPHERIP